jgi:hypothetical protein
MTPQSGLPPATDRARRRWAIAAVFIAVLVVALVVALALRDGTDGAANGTAGSAIPTASDAVASPSASAAATAEAPSTAATAEAPIEEGWIAAATFSEPGRRYVLGDLAAWSGGLIAIGTWFESEERANFGPPPAHEGRVWRSTDGTEWADATPGGTFDQVELQHLFETADGALIIIGDRWTGPERTSAAWASSDGESWEPVVLDGVPADALVTRVGSGAKGHLAGAYVGNEMLMLYSADGRLWEATGSNVTSVGDLGAGDEGFVASIFRGDGAPVIVASSDGREWFDSPTRPGGAFLVAPRGGDWLAMTTMFGGVPSVATSQSANGLDWSPLGDVPLGTFASSDLSCSEVPGAIHGLPGLLVLGTVLSGPCGEGAVVSAGASYTSLDGVDWTRLPFGDQAFAAAAVTVGDSVIVATDTRTHAAENIGVIFWIRHAP